MRGAEDIPKKSATDMAAIFGVRADACSPSAVVDPKNKTSTSSDRRENGGARERKNRSRDKEGYNDNGSSNRKRDKKRKQFSE